MKLTSFSSELNQLQTDFHFFHNCHYNDVEKAISKNFMHFVFFFFNLFYFYLMLLRSQPTIRANLANQSHHFET